MAESDTRHWVIQGRVQGVGFRIYVLQKATNLGLRGYTRNMSNGTVEVVASGKPELLNQLEANLRHGPPGSEVTAVTASEYSHDAAKLPAIFEIIT